MFFPCLVPFFCEELQNERRHGRQRICPGGNDGLSPLCKWDFGGGWLVLKGLMSLGNKGSPLFPRESGVKSQRVLKCHFLVGLYVSVFPSVTSFSAVYILL